MARFNFYAGATASAWLLAILVIAAELIAPFKNLLKSIFSHHWIGKAVIITLTFIVFGFLFKEKTSIGKLKDESVSWFSVIGSLVVILLFYVIEFFV